MLIQWRRSVASFRIQCSGIGVVAHNGRCSSFFNHWPMNSTVYFSALEGGCAEFFYCSWPAFFTELSSYVQDGVLMG